MRALLETVVERPPWLLRVLVALAMLCHLAGPYTPQFQLLYAAMAALFLLALAADDARTGRAIWLLATALFLFNLGWHYTRAANHEFVLAYFAVLAAILWRPEADVWAQAARFSAFLFGLMMGLALLQKLASPYYMSGDLLGQFLLQRTIYGNITPLLFDGVPAAARESMAARDALMADYAASAGGAVPLPPIDPGLKRMALAMTWVSLLFQGAVEVGLLFRRRAGIWLHYGIFLFVLTIYAMRPEHVFIALSCLMGYAMTDARSKGMRLPYAIMIAWLLLTYVFDYRPAIFA